MEPLIQTRVIVTNDYDIIDLTETFLDSSIDNDDRMSIPGYNLLRVDHPSNTKRGGVCIYYKDHHPIMKRNDLCQLHECLVTELRIGKKKCFFTCFRSSHRRCPVRKCVLRNFAKFTGKHLCQISFLIKLQA